MLLSRFDVSNGFVQQSSRANLFPPFCFSLFFLQKPNQPRKYYQNIVCETFSRMTSSQKKSEQAE